MTVQKITILVTTFVTIILGTASRRRHRPMTAGLKLVTTLGNLDNPVLFLQHVLDAPTFV
jgi:hypothetical protein